MHWRRKPDRAMWRPLTIIFSLQLVSWPCTMMAQDTTRAPSVGLPLASSRMVHFAVREGTWISLDVSPDGRTIVFELLGQLYSLPMGGGKADPLTSGLAFNRQPRFSPDGKHLAFISDRSGSANLWISDRDGRHARQLSNLRGYAYGAATSPCWSPDGRTIVLSQMLGAARPGLVGVSRNLRWLLASYDVATGRMRWISDTTADRARSALGPAFAPDGRAVYAAIDEFRKDSWSGPENWRIGRIDVQTSEITPTTGSLVGRVGMRPAVDRAGRYLVYASNSGSHLGFRVRDLQTDKEWWLTRESLDDAPFESSVDSRDLVPGYAFTPDGKFLVVGYGGKIHRLSIETGGAQTIPFVAEISQGLGPLAVHQFALADTAVHTRSLMHPALSPDGRRVAFSVLDRIWVMELPIGARPGGRPYRLTNDTVGEFYPSWAPDGRWMAYSTWEDGTGGTVRRVDVSEVPHAGPSISMQLTSDSALYFDTAVAPDGNSVVAVRATMSPDRALIAMSSPDPVLVSIPARGGDSHNISDLASEYHSNYPYPADQVYFTSNPESIYVGLRSIPWKGGMLHPSVQITGREDTWKPYLTTGVMSPNRQRALVYRKYTLFQLRLPEHAAIQSPTIDLERDMLGSFGAAESGAQRWGTALNPWISWSRNGSRVVFSQGGTLFVGDVRGGEWISFTRCDVPLMISVDSPQGSLLLRGARLITMRRGEVIARGDIVITGNRIVAVGPTGSVQAPRGARVLDLRGKTIIPGYVDVHDHMVLPRGLHPQQCWQCLTILSYGVTAVRDPQPAFANDVFTYRELERTGSLIGPRIFSTGMAYFGTDPPVQTLDEARDAVRPNAAFWGSETFKVYQDPSSSRAAQQLLAIAASDMGLNATIHGQGIERELTAVLDGFSGLEHAPQNRIYNDVATLIALSGTTHTQTFGAAVYGAWHYMFRRYGGIWEHNKMRRFAPPSARSLVCGWCTKEPWFGPPEHRTLLSLLSVAKKVLKKGGRIAIGSHGDIPGIGYHYELWLHALAGIDNYEILHSATLVGAAAIGHGADFGSIEPGKLADLQVLDKDPLKDIRNTTTLRYVMKNGRLYKADDLAEMWPRHRPLPSIYMWEQRAPAGSRDVLRQ
jgi:amidohydrolase family protein/WD40 repeat protein